MTNPTGAWELPDELSMLRDTVRRFMRDVVTPLEDTLEHNATGPSSSELHDLQRQAREIGLWALATPESFGGAGLSVLVNAWWPKRPLSVEWGRSSRLWAHFGGNPPSVLFKGTPEQFERQWRGA